MSEHTQYPWLFKGAYATYCGTSKLGRIPGEFDATTKLQVDDIDLTNKRVKLRSTDTMHQRMWRINKKVSEDDVTDWRGIDDRSLISKTPIIMEGETEGQIQVESLGIRKCIISQYGKPGSLSKAIVFWDKEFNWPLHFIAILRHVSKSPSLVDMVKESYDFVTKFDLQAALKNSSNETLRENSLVMYLKETNIPFMTKQTQP